MCQIFRFLTIFCAMLLSLGSCSKEMIPDCQILEMSLLSRNQIIVQEEINSLIKDLSLNRFDESDFDRFAKVLDERCDGLAVVDKCYSCIYTLPAISHLGVELDSLGSLVQRYIDIWSPEDETMYFGGLH